MKESVKECGKVYCTANVYKINCSICHEHIEFHSFIVHHRNHLNALDETTSSKNINIKEEFPAAIAVYGNDDVNLWNTNNGSYSAVSSKNDSSDEEDDFLWDNITDSNEESDYKKKSVDDEDFEEDIDDFSWDNVTDDEHNTTKAAIINDKDEPLIDIKTLFGNKKTGVETQVKPLSPVESDSESSSQCSDRNTALSTKESADEANAAEQNHDSMAVDANANDTNDDNDSYTWDIDSCDAEYPDINPTKRKKKYVVDEPATAYKCEVCAAGFNTPVGLAVHMRTHQTREKIKKPEFKCVDCGKILRSERALRTHKYKHTGVFCEICNKQFSNVGNMDRHRLMHEGKKDFQCPYCGECFYTTSEMKNHCAKHTGVRRVMCEVCGKPCRDRGVLAQHMLRHTGERPVKCNICNKSFFSNHDLKQHIVIHSEDRPFVCETCGATFQRKKSLRVHKKIHSNAPFTEECKVCGKKFVNASGLLSHMRVHDAVYGLSYPVGGWINPQQ